METAGFVILMYVTSGPVAAPLKGKMNAALYLLEAPEYWLKGQPKSI